MFSDYFDDSYPEDVRSFLNSLLDTTQRLAYLSTDIQAGMSLIGVFLNLFHIIVLLQKSSRSQATNILILGIAISDFVFLMFYVDGKGYELMVNAEPYECTPPKSFSRTLWSWILFTFKDAFRRMSAWLGVFLALIRFLVMRYGTNSKIKVLMNTSTSWKIFFSTLFFSLVITMINQGRYIIMKYRRWVPMDVCTMYHPNTTFPCFERVQNPALNDYQYQISAKYLLIDGFFKITPPIFYPFLALGLVSQLKKARDGRRILMKKEEENEMIHVTRFVICMTIAFFLAETPAGVSEFIMAFYFEEDLGMLFLVNNITVLFVTFLIFNSSIHCLFCFFLSSQYRQTLYQMFGCRRVGRTGVANSRNLSTSS